MRSRRSGDEASDLPARSRFGEGRAETLYGSTSVFQCLEKIPFARRPITHNSKRPHSEAEEPDRLLRPYLPSTMITTQSLRGRRVSLPAPPSVGTGAGKQGRG